ncbi:hypothetical protein P4S93_09175 [Aneurinibacillus thermoaerophilus]|uniref:hypothetical protein n=1 Tax=Aneurinibacillus thermoaerophilus TaxID=143495 RepID=UPI002E20FF07|nr:hypothetical protein [Aneurinibacillus thermoaerophilus]MED0760949.1 hypothetical protein [Aneurinibacillus thermoaerophilus]
MARPDVGGSISNLLYLSLRNLYEKSVDEIAQHNIRRVGINGYSPYAITVIPMAVNVWEAFLNENIIGRLIWPEFKENVLSDIKDEVDKLDIKAKSLLYLRLTFGETFDKSKYPFQDFSKLVVLRNAIVHFKQLEAPINHIKDLSHKGITLPKEPNTQLSWTLELSSTEIFVGHLIQSLLWSKSFVNYTVSLLEKMIFPY